MGIVLALVAPAIVACTSSSNGTPVARIPDGGVPASSPSPTAEAKKSLRDLDMCTLLSPADLPVQPDQGGKTKHEPRSGGEGCGATVQLSDLFSILSTLVSRRPKKFTEFIPPPDSPNGRSAVISGRTAWVGSPFKGSEDKDCAVVTGAADGYLTITVLDETKRGVPPCQTATLVAEKVIARTPAPY